MTDFDIEAVLSLETRAALGGIRSLGGQLSALGDRISGANGMFGGMVQNVLALGAGYIGVNALASGFSGLVRSAAEFETSMQTTEIGLSSIMRSVEGVSFEQARQLAGSVFNDLTDAALRSTATTEELFGIYSSIYGPIRSAGYGLEDILGLTSQTALAASALGVDFQQASRDVSAMVRGSAGIDVRLFSALHSMGAITEDAQEFNRLTQAERISRLQAALQGFDEAGEAYATSLPGVTSSFMDVAQQLRRAAFRPVFDVLATSLGSVNERLLANREGIESVLSGLGERAAGALSNVFDRAFDGIDYITTHWGEFQAQIERVVATVYRMAPYLMSAARSFAMIQIGRQVVGSGISALGAGASFAGSLGGLLGGGAAAAEGGAAAAAGGAAAAGAGGAGGLAALGPILEGLSVAAAPLALALGAVTSLVSFATEYWDGILAVFEPLTPMLEGVYQEFERIGLFGGQTLSPVLDGVGFILAAILIPTLQLLLVVIRGAAAAFADFLEITAYVAEAVQGYLDEAVESFLEAARYISVMIGDLFGDATNSAARDREAQEAAHRAVGDLREQATRDAEAPEPSLTAPPTGRSTTHNDFRGSRISVRQEFREADPDRVAVDMINDIARLAEQRTQSGFVPALTR